MSATTEPEVAWTALDVERVAAALAKFEGMGTVEVARSAARLDADWLRYLRMATTDIAAADAGIDLGAYDSSPLPAGLTAAASELWERVREEVTGRKPRLLPGWSNAAQGARVRAYDDDLDGGE